MSPRRVGTARPTNPPQYHRCDPAAMAATCRKLAGDLRAEAAMGWPPIRRQEGDAITRAEAAVSLDAQAARWEAEVATGERNEYDRARIRC